MSEKPSMKERILETADRLFYLQGIRAVGVDTIAAEIGISKRTLYNHFPSKDDLISAYLSRRFHKAPASDKPPAEQILGTFDSLERRFASRDFRGCPFVNAVAELGPEDRAVRKIAVAFKESRRVWFRDLLMQLDVADADALATQLTLLVDGSIAQDLVREDPRWRAPRGRPRACCWRMRASGLATTPRRRRESGDPYVTPVRRKTDTPASFRSSTTAGDGPAFAATTHRYAAAATTRLRPSCLAR